MTNPGWECPKCGSVYAPTVTQCGKCEEEKWRGLQHMPLDCDCPFIRGRKRHRLSCPEHPWQKEMQSR